jgi:Flp pilus assembly pilin Flp
MFSRLMKDEAGFVVSAELIFIATLLVIGLVAGWVAIRNTVVSELSEVAAAIGSVDQSYSFTGLSNCGGMTAGSQAIDTYTSIQLISVGAVGNDITVAVCP